MRRMHKKQELGKASFEYKKDMSHFPLIAKVSWFRTFGQKAGYAMCRQ